MNCCSKPLVVRPSPMKNTCLRAGARLLTLRLWSVVKSSAAGAGKGGYGIVEEHSEEAIVGCRDVRFPMLGFGYVSAHFDSTIGRIKRRPWRIRYCSRGLKVEETARDHRDTLNKHGRLARRDVRTDYVPRTSRGAVWASPPATGYSYLGR